MPLPPPTASRQPLHTRTITVRGYKREDGCYDIEGFLNDVKAIDFHVQGEMRPPGTDIHSMWLRITVDRALNIVDAAAASDAMPYVGFCDRITPEYRKLVGLAIRPGFTTRVRELFGETRGCTHITELIGSVATTAFQTLAGQGAQSPDQRPFQIDGCHALKSDAPAVAKFYPRWYTGADKPEVSMQSEAH